MLLIPCPHCGLRDEVEFHYAGEPRPRPGPAPEVSDAAWGDYLYLKSNEKGRHRELWHHAAGCGRVFFLTRDTVTHAVLEVALPGAEHGEGGR